jgi:hypothetical protein
LANFTPVVELDLLAVAQLHMSCAHHLLAELQAGHYLRPSCANLAGFDLPSLHAQAAVAVFDDKPPSLRTDCR